MKYFFRHIRRYPWIMSLIVGASIFILVAGYSIIDPRNIAWLTIGDDPAQHYLGWEFFRNTHWSSPVGSNPNYGLAISSSIVFSDSIPLLAFLFKPFSYYLSNPFQYLGIWVFLSFMLQALFAYLITTLFTNSYVVSLLCSALIVFSPVLIWRVNEHAVNSHFLILASIYLVLRPDNKHREVWWTLLLSSTLLVHFYLFAMILPLWVADILDRFKVIKKESFSNVIREIVIIGIVICVCFWQAGYLNISTDASVANELYGYWTFDPLSLFGSRGWSYIFPDIASANHSIDNFIYFGSGIILLLIISIVNAIIFKKQFVYVHLRRHIFLVITLFLYTIFAISHNVHIGDLKFNFELPEFILHWASIFRWSGKFIWPVYYLIIFFIFYLIIKGFSAKIVSSVLFLSLVIQVIDTSAGWLPRRYFLNQLNNSKYDSPLTDPFWIKAAKQYRYIRVVPLQNVARQPHWGTFAPFAAIHKMGTDSVYLARYDSRNVEKSNLEFQNSLFKKAVDQNTLYIFDDRLTSSVIAHIDRSRDLVARIDNLNVLAPNWDMQDFYTFVNEKKIIDAFVLNVKLNQNIDFSENGNGKYLSAIGWAVPEKWGVWADSARSSITFSLPKKFDIEDFGISFKANALISESHPAQRINIFVNGIKMSKVVLSKAENNSFRVPINIKHLRSNFVTVEFEFLDRIRPIDLGIGSDRRLLSVGIISAQFTNGSDKETQ